MLKISVEWQRALLKSISAIIFKKPLSKMKKAPKIIHRTAPMFHASMFSSLFFSRSLGAGNIVAVLSVP